MKGNYTRLAWVALVLALALGLAACQGEERAVRERIAIDARSDSYFYNGADLIFYSDDHSTDTITLDGGEGSIELSTLTLSGDLTAATAAIGGGYGDTGASISAAGVGQFNGALTVDGASTLTGAVSAPGGMTGDVTGALTLATDDFVTLTPGTSITVTNGAAFTPTATYQPVVAAGEVTPTITAGATAGRLVVLTNTGTNVINLADSGTLMLSAAAALGQYDSLTIVSDGTNWIEISRSDN
jgi:hypothetical protein